MKILPSLAALLLLSAAASAQLNSAPQKTAVSTPSHEAQLTPIPLTSTGTMNVPSEMGRAFMFPSKCDEDGNLFIREFAGSRAQLGPVVKINPKGEHKALFDPAAFLQPTVDRADAFSPAPDGGLYQIAQKGIEKPEIYVLRFSSDGSPSSSVRLAADLEVYTFAAFPSGNFLISGVKRDVRGAKDRGKTFTAVYSADGRFLKQLSFESSNTNNDKPNSAGAGASPAAAPKAGEKEDEKEAPLLDLSAAEAGKDGNLYVMRPSSPPAVYVITPEGKIIRTLTITVSQKDVQPTAFYISGNQLAISFSGDQNQLQTLEIVDAQTGRTIRLYSYDPSLAGSDSNMVPAFGCFDANGGTFTFLALTEGSGLQIIRAGAR